MAKLAKAGFAKTTSAAMISKGNRPVQSFDFFPLAFLQ